MPGTALGQWTTATAHGLHRLGQEGTQALVGGEDVLGQPALEELDLGVGHGRVGLRQLRLQFLRRRDQLAVGISVLAISG